MTPMKVTHCLHDAAIDIDISVAPSCLLGSIHACCCEGLAAGASPSHVGHLDRGHAATGDGLKLGPHRSQKDAKVQRQYHKQPDQHHEAIEDVEVDLMVGDGPMPALAELDEPEDVTDEQQHNSDVQAGVDGLQSRGPDTVEGGGGDVDKSGQEEEDD